MYPNHKYWGGQITRLESVCVVYRAHKQTTASNYSCVSCKQTWAVECVIKTLFRAARQLWVMSAVGLYEWINSQAFDVTWCRTATIRLRSKMAECSIRKSLVFFTNCSGSVAWGAVTPHNLRLGLLFLSSSLICLGLCFCENNFRVGLVSVSQDSIRRSYTYIWDINLTLQKSIDKTCQCFQENMYNKKVWPSYIYIYPCICLSHLKSKLNFCGYETLDWELN